MPPRSTLHHFLTSTSCLCPSCLAYLLPVVCLFVCLSVCLSALHRGHPSDWCLSFCLFCRCRCRCHTPFPTPPSPAGPTQLSSRSVVRWPVKAQPHSRVLCFSLLFTPLVPRRLSFARSALPLLPAPPSVLLLLLHCDNDRFLPAQSPPIQPAEPTPAPAKPAPAPAPAPAPVPSQAERANERLETLGPNLLAWCAWAALVCYRELSRGYLDHYLYNSTPPSTFVPLRTPVTRPPPPRDPGTAKGPSVHVFLSAAARPSSPIDGGVVHSFIPASICLVLLSPPPSSTRCQNPILAIAAGKVNSDEKRQFAP